jgi:hypothetical protein
MCDVRYEKKQFLNRTSHIAYLKSQNYFKRTANDVHTSFAWHRGVKVEPWIYRSLRGKV